MSDPKDPTETASEESLAGDEHAEHDATEGEKSAADDEPRAARSERPSRENRPKKRRRDAARREPTPSGSSATVAVIIALAAGAAGAAGGWFGHDAQAKAKLRADSAAPAGSSDTSGPCGAWTTKICSPNDAAAACAEAKAAVNLLTPSTCEAALASLPATLAKIKASRAPCDKLVGKLCGDLAPGSQTCAMVKERTPSFPTERCTEMLEHYDDVIASLKQMDQQGGPALAGRPPGAPGAP